MRRFLSWLIRKPRIIGRTVQVGLPQFGITNVTAKVDSGAFSGALHATGIREIKGSKGMRLEFTPLLQGRNKVRTEQFHIKSVKSSNGAVSMRYVIDTEVEIRGQILPITITLSDRSSMRYPIIIGRKFLRTHGFLIDVSADKQ